MLKYDFNKVSWHFSMGVFLTIGSAFSDHLYIRAPTESCFCGFLKQLEIDSGNELCSLMT